MTTQTLTVTTAWQQISDGTQTKSVQAKALCEAAWEDVRVKLGKDILFPLPVDGQEFFIKRVIGLPGDTIDLKNGYVYITNAEHPNGYKLDEPYLSSVNQGNTQPLIPGKTKFVVPAGRYLVFGDNRVVSTDARSCFRSSLGSGCQFEGDSYIGTENIEGRASLILFPLNKMGFIKNPHTTN